MKLLLPARRRESPQRATLEVLAGNGLSALDGQHLGFNRLISYADRVLSYAVDQDRSLNQGASEWVRSGLHSEDLAGGFLTILASRP